jgi:hypothetical protein
MGSAATREQAVAVGARHTLSRGTLVRTRDRRDPAQAFGFISAHQPRTNCCQGADPAVAAFRHKLPEDQRAVAWRGGKLEKIGRHLSL